jgi:hypothetical protein
MPSTIQQLVNAALQLIEQLPPGYSASSDHLNTGLDSFNRMVDSWSAEGVSIYALTLDIFTTNGSQAYTWGTAGTITTARPVQLKKVQQCVLNGMAMAFRMVTADEWQAIEDQTETGYPEVGFYDYAQPLGTLRLWPVPGNPSTINLWSFKALIGNLGLGSQPTLPAGYEEALRFNLAVELAAEFRRPVSKEVAERAVSSKAAIARLATATLGAMFGDQ